MANCLHCGKELPIKINKISGLPRKNLSQYCSEVCRWAIRGKTYLRKPRVYKPRPRQSKSKTYHCCAYCGKESMKVLESKDKNFYCSPACAGAVKSKVSRESAALRRIGVNYVKPVDIEALQQEREEKEKQRQIAEFLTWYARQCDMCGKYIPQEPINGCPTKRCDACEKKAKKAQRKRTRDQFRKKHPEEYALRRGAALKRRNASKKRRLPKWAGELDAFVWLEATRLVALRKRVTGGDWHADHMIPLAGVEASGLHVWNNCQVIPGLLNSLKRNTHTLTEPGEWLSTG